MAGIGWVALHRKIQDHWLWDEKPFSKGHAWIDLILMANHEEKKVLLGNELIVVKVGETITSIENLKRRWGWSNTKVLAFLKLLESDGMLVKKSDTKKTLISIVNYDIYSTYDEAENDAETPQKRYGNDTATMREHTNNNDNNDNNDNNSVGTPTLSEVMAVCRREKYVVDPSVFYNHYQGRGWRYPSGQPITDWRAVLAKWNAEDLKKNKGGFSGRTESYDESLYDNIDDAEV